MTTPLSSSLAGGKQLDAIWTRVVIDPIADRLVRPLVPLTWISPNRITLVAGLLALAAAGAFGAGWLVVGAVLFQLRFLVDCLDGRLARMRGCGTAWGGALDVLVDTGAVLLCFAALAHQLVVMRAADTILVAAVLASCGFYCWTLAQRKSLPGGEQRDWRAERYVTGTSLRHRYVAAMARRGMVPTPYAVEVEAFALTLAPLTTVFWPARGPDVAAAGLWVAVGFYLVASALNVYRTWRLTRITDQREQHP